MRLTDLNAPGGIGANCLLLQLGKANIVIDAGLHPKMAGYEALPRLERIRDLPIDLIIVTHCHLDHLGALPVLARDHPDTPIILSRDSQYLYKRLLQNSCQVMERQRAEGLAGAIPLYGFADITQCARQVVPVVPGNPRLFETTSGERFSFTLFPSGHIPGAVGLLLEYRQRRIFHTGDVSFADTPMLDGARFPPAKVDTLILETTRGTTERGPGTNRESESRRLLQYLRRTLKGGGSVLIPVFALGRMQELLTMLRHASAGKMLPDCPVYVSGLGLDLLNGFERIAKDNRALRVRRRFLRELGARKLPEGHRPGSEGPAIYLLSSGMLIANTPSYKAAAALLRSRENTICFVGYCDPDTPGGKLLAAEPESTFLFEARDQQVPVRAAIERFDLSSHADREELRDFALACEPRVVVLSHGDPEARAWFRGELEGPLGKDAVLDPPPLRTVEV
mgnify:CR=1 FL=1